MIYKIISIRPIGDIVVDEIVANSKGQAMYKFYMDNPNSDIQEITEKVSVETPESKKVFEKR